MGSLRSCAEMKDKEIADAVRQLDALAASYADEKNTPFALLACFSLIRQCIETNAESSENNIYNFTISGVNHGDWKVLVKKNV